MQITPKNPNHPLFGHVLSQFKAEVVDGFEYVYGEIKEGLHWIEARFEKSEVVPVTPALTQPDLPAQAAPAPSTPPAINVTAPPTVAGS